MSFPVAVQLVDICQTGIITAQKEEPISTLLHRARYYMASL